MKGLIGSADVLDQFSSAAFSQLHYRPGKNSKVAVGPMKPNSACVGPHASVLTALDHPQYNSLDGSLISSCQKQHGKASFMSLWAEEEKRGNVDDL